MRPASANPRWSARWPPRSAFASSTSARSLLDPVDLRGLPTVEHGKAAWAIPAFLPEDGAGILFLDELNAAPPLVYCIRHRENLCDDPLFTGYTRDGGFATATVADARFAFPLGETSDDVSLAPLLCAGLIGWRSLVIAGEGKRLGLYGFGAAAHILAQVATWQGRSVYAFTRPGDSATQRFAKSLGATWAGGSDEMPPERLDAAIIFATVGDLVPLALKAVRKGGRVVCAGIHMSDIPSFAYSLLWEERQLLSVANLTRQDGLDFLKLVPQIGIVTKTTVYPLKQANQALSDLRAGRFDGAAVLTP